jgi:dodecin
LQSFVGHGRPRTVRKPGGRAPGGDILPDRNAAIEWSAAAGKAQVGGRFGDEPRLDPGRIRVASSKPSADARKQARKREGRMAESVYKVIELVGTSSDSWEKAAKAAIERASRSLRDMRVAEVVEQDLVIEKGKVEAFRTKLKVSFKYEGKDD